MTHSELSADEAALTLLSAQAAETYQVLPLRIHSGQLVVAVADATDRRALRAVRFATQLQVIPQEVPAGILADAIERYYGAELETPASTNKPPVIAHPAGVKPPITPAAGMAKAPAPSPAPRAPAPAPPQTPSQAPPVRPLPTPPSIPVPLVAQGAAAGPIMRSPEAGAPVSPPVPTVDPAMPIAHRAVERADASALENPDPDALQLLSAENARLYHALPLQLEGDTVVIALPTPPDLKVLRALKFATGRANRILVVPDQDLEHAILKHYPAGALKVKRRVGSIPTVAPRILEALQADVVGLLPAEIARRHRALPVQKMGGRLSVALADPNDMAAVEEIEQATGHTVKPLGCDAAALDAAIARYYP